MWKSLNLTVCFVPIVFRGLNIPRALPLNINSKSNINAKIVESDGLYRTYRFPADGLTASSTAKYKFKIKQKCENRRIARFVSDLLLSEGWTHVGAPPRNINSESNINPKIVEAHGLFRTWPLTSVENTASPTAKYKFKTNQKCDNRRISRFVPYLSFSGGWIYRERYRQI